MPVVLRRALLSVSDKTGLISFASKLVSLSVGVNTSAILASSSRSIAMELQLLLQNFSLSSVLP
jgi:AICAR transformylase/IMP cyclohydrolase PurH